MSNWNEHSGSIAPVGTCPRCGGVHSIYGGCGSSAIPPGQPRAIDPAFDPTPDPLPLILDELRAIRKLLEGENR